MCLSETLSCFTLYYFTALPSTWCKVSECCFVFRKKLLRCLILFKLFVLYSTGQTELVLTPGRRHSKRKDGEKIEFVKSMLFVGTMEHSGQLLWGDQRIVCCWLNKYFPFRTTKLLSLPWGIYGWSGRVNMPNNISLRIKLRTVTGAVIAQSV
jgi:hypothetical protein